MVSDEFVFINGPSKAFRIWARMSGYLRGQHCPGHQAAAALQPKARRRRALLSCVFVSPVYCLVLLAFALCAVRTVCCLRACLWLSV